VKFVRPQRVGIATSDDAGVTSSCHWNQLNVSNHTDGRTNTLAQLV
jgi:hypothetical protein